MNAPPPQRLLGALAATMLLASACFATDDKAACEACGSGGICEDGACLPVATPEPGAMGVGTHVALRADGRRVIATWDASRDDLRVLFEQPGGGLTARLVDGWQVTDGLPEETSAGRWSDLAIAPSPGGGTEMVHVAWYRATGGQLWYAQVPTADGPVAPESVDGDGAPDRGRHVSLAVGEDGVVHVGYRDETARGLRYARRDLTGQWSSEAIEPCADEADCPAEDGEDYGEYAAVVVGGGEPRIAFYDRQRGDLKLALRGADGAWTVSTIDGRDSATGLDTGDMGRFVSVAVDHKFRLGLAYFDATRGALRYFLPGGAVGHPVVVDDGRSWDEASGTVRQRVVGQHVALRFDAKGQAAMVYLDATRLVLRRASVTGATISEPTDLAVLAAGQDIDFGIAASGAWRGAYGAWGDGADPFETRLTTFELDGGAR